MVSADGVANGDRPEDQLAQRVGGVPYGFRAEGSVLVEDADEQATVARARELRAEGLSLRAIGRALIEDGHRPRNGRGWHVQVVARIAAG